MKKLFNEPEMDVVRFALADIITVSGQLDEDELPPIIFQ